MCVIQHQQNLYIIPFQNHTNHTQYYYGKQHYLPMFQPPSFTTTAICCPPSLLLDDFGNVGEVPDSIVVNF
jgi:hypothetical protein